MDYSSKAKELFNSGYNCSQAVVLAFKDKLNLDEKTLVSLSSSFGGGISRLREVCGCISGMAIVLGLLYGNYDVNDNEAKAKHYQMIQKLALQFKEKYNTYNCAELLNLEKGPSNYVPEKRSKEYYEKRPCGNYIAFMASLIEREIKEHE